MSRLSVDTVLHGCHDAVGLCCSLDDATCAIDASPVSIGLFAKVFELSQGYVADFSFADHPCHTIDREPVSQRVHAAVQEAVQRVHGQEETLFRSTGRIKLRYPPLGQCLPDEHPTQAAPEPRTAGRHFGHPTPIGLGPRPRASKCLAGDYYLTAPQLIAIRRARLGDRDARRHLLGWFLPLRQWLVSKYQEMRGCEGDLEFAAMLAILSATSEYPEKYLRHSWAWIDYDQWIDGWVEKRFCEALHLWPYHHQYMQWRIERLISQRRDHPMQEPRPGYWHIRQTVATAGQRDLGTGQPGCVARNETPIRSGAHTDLPFGSLVAEAKAGSIEARGELCMRLHPLITRLTSKYSFPKDDLAQEASIALISALDEYDPARGPFIPLAKWRIADALERWAKQEPLAADEYTEAYDADKADEHTSGQTAYEVVKQIVRWWEEDNGEWGSYGIWGGAGKDLGVAMAESLELEDRMLLSRLFGLPGFNKATQQELAAELGITQQAVSKRAKKAIEDLQGIDWREIWRRRYGEDWEWDYW